MPSLVICGNKTFLGGDDLRVYGLFAICLRLIQIAALIPFTVLTAGHFSIENVPEACQGNGLVEHSAAIFIPYLILAWFLAVAGLCLELGIWKTTGKGTPAQPERRSKLRPFCWIKMIPMSLFRVSVLVLAAFAILMIRDLCLCDACPRGSYNQWNGKQ